MKGIKFWAARYYMNEGDYVIALYDRDQSPDETPHDWSYDFNRKQWQALGMPVPPKNGNMLVTMRMTVVEED